MTDCSGGSQACSAFTSSAPAALKSQANAPHGKGHSTTTTATIIFFESITSASHQNHCLFLGSSQYNQFDSDQLFSFSTLACSAGDSCLHRESQLCISDSVISGTQRWTNHSGKIETHSSSEGQLSLYWLTILRTCLARSKIAPASLLPVTTKRTVPSPNGTSLSLGGTDSRARSLRNSSFVFPLSADIFACPLNNRVLQLPYLLRS